MKIWDLRQNGFAQALGPPPACKSCQLMPAAWMTYDPSSPSSGEFGIFWYYCDDCVPKQLATQALLEGLP